MASLYLESSAVLSWLLGEPDAEKVRHAVDRAATVLSAVSATPLVSRFARLGLALMAVLRGTQVHVAAVCAERIGSGEQFIGSLR